MPRWKWFQRPQEPIDCTGPATVYAHQAGAYGLVPQQEPQKRPQATREALRRRNGHQGRYAMAEPPHAVQVAGYMLDFHQRKTCPHCRADGTCPRVEMSKLTIRSWRLKVEARRRQARLRLVHH